jgi:Zn-dependent M28 family amino/carboxypeptidase
MAVTGEEKGLLGSEYYATHPLYPLGKTVSAINTDVMQINGPARDYSVRGKAQLDLVDDLKAIASARGRTFTPERHPETGGFYRSDHFSLAKVGVPAITFSPGLDLVKGGLGRGEALAADYTAKRYHQPDDEWLPTWDFTGVAEDAALLHDLGLRLANSREWPNWTPDSEFRATRDQSAAERSGAAPASLPAPEATSPKKGERG